MSAVKVRKTLTLDPELIDALGADDAALSSTVNAILRREGGRHERTVRAALAAAVAERADVLVLSAVLSECYRGAQHDQVIDACLAREGGIDVASTDRPLARRVGHLLAAAGWGSEHHVDATVISVCAAAGGGLVLTGDLSDLSTLAPAGSGIVVRDLTDG